MINKLFYIRFYSRVHKAALVRCMSLLMLFMAAQASHADINKVVNINVLDMDIAEVMAMLAAKEKVNILVNKGVEGDISLNLYQVTVKDIIEAAARALELTSKLSAEFKMKYYGKN